MYIDGVQAKIVILYTLHKFRLAMSMDQLYRVILDNDILDYFSFMHYFYDLLEYGYVKATIIEEKTRYDIQPKGTEAVELFTNKIPPGVRSKIDRTVDEILSSYEKVMDIRAVTTAISERKFVAKCGIYEWNVPLLEINITVGDKDQAEKIAKYFKENATQIYQDTFNILGMKTDANK
jgi:hypothetical protein